MRPTTLAMRMSMLCAGVAVGSALLAGVMAVSLIDKSANNARLHELGKLADSVASADRIRPAVDAASDRLLATLRIRRCNIAPSGAVLVGGACSQLAASSLPARSRRALLAGRSETAVRTVGGVGVLVAGRPIAQGGGFWLIQRQSDATAVDRTATRRVLLALLIGTALATGGGLVASRRMSRSVRAAATAARALATGRRDVSVSSEGPAEVVELAVAVNALATALSQSERRQQEFLRSISHDLRTPLTPIIANAESLADGLVPVDQVPGIGVVIGNEARRLQHLVGDLLELARLEADDFHLDFAVIDMCSVASDAAMAWTKRCEELGLHLRTEIDPRPLLAWTDAIRVRQLLDALLDNAIRMAPAGAPIVLATRAHQDGVQVEVRDGGPGLTDEDLAEAFKPGVLHDRYRGVREVGTGLGLAIVDRLVSRLGGTRSASRAPEGGASFAIALPGPRERHDG